MSELPTIERLEFEHRPVEIDMFENAQVIESGESQTLHVPTRTIDFGKYGKWKIDVHGKTAWFKQYDDYGEMRVTRNGRAFWLPHVYAFEEVDARNLPLIRDRERMRVWVTADRLETGVKRPEYDWGLLLATTHGKFGCPRSLDSWASGGIDTYDWFFSTDREPYAEELLDPDDMSNRENNAPWRAAEGALWVPVDEIGKQDAKVSFPMFDEQLQGELE